MTIVIMRLYLGGKMADETSVQLGVGAREAIGDVGEYHGEMARCATEEGLPWMVEIVFPDGEHVRWGTDSDGMVEPMPVTQLAELLKRYLSP